MLLSAGASIDKMDSSGMTPFSWAIINSHFGIISLFVDIRAISDRTNEDKQTSLAQIGPDNHYQIIQFDSGGTGIFLGEGNLEPPIILPQKLYDWTSRDAEPPDLSSD